MLVDLHLFDTPDHDARMTMLTLAAALMFVTGLAHSYLGERYILTRLFKRDNLPRLFGGTAFTVGTLRFAWHLTTIAWWGLAALVLLSARGELDSVRALKVIGFVGLVSGLFPVVFTRGKHLSWIVFFVVGVLLLLAAYRS